MNTWTSWLGVTVDSPYRMTSSARRVFRWNAKGDYLKILTFNHHESYIALLAEAGHDLHVVTKKGSLDLSWGNDRIPCPSNVKCIEWTEQLQKDIEQGQFAVIIIHTIKNLFWVWKVTKTPIIFIAHIPLFKNSFLKNFKSFFKRTLLKIFMLTHRCHFVCVSPWKSSTWGIAGSIIEPSFNSFPSLSSEGANPDGFKIALVCNHIKQRQEELGWTTVKQVLAEFPLVIIGNNPDVAEAVRMKDFASFQNYLQRFSVYFYPIQIPFGDGYNLALLEAMSMGMVPVTLFNPSSPVVHMENGLVAHNFDELRQHFHYLKDHPEELRRMGRAAKTSVENRFSKKLFLEKWQAVFFAATRQGGA